jgi:hypothetical protein
MCGLRSFEPEDDPRELKRVEELTLEVTCVECVLDYLH